MKQKFQIFKNKYKLKLIPLFLLITTTVIFFCYLLFLTYYQGRIFPGVAIASYDVGGQTPAVVNKVLNSDLEKRFRQPLKLNYQNQNFAINLNDTSPQINLNDNITEAYALGRSGNIFQNLKDQLNALIIGTQITPVLTYQHPALLLYQLQNINQQIKKLPKNARLTLGEDIIITPSEDGLELDNKLLVKQIEAYLTLNNSFSEEIPVMLSPATFTTNQAEETKEILQNIKNNSLTLHSEAGVLVIDQVALFNLLDLTRDKKSISEINNEVSFLQTEIIEAKNLSKGQIVIDRDKLQIFLKKFSDAIDREAKEARFVFNPQTKRVTEFQSSQEGRKVDIDQTSTFIASAVTLGHPKDLDVPIKITKPSITTSDADNLGITTLLGEGVSYFAGSIDNRIYNIGLAASRINGVLVKPGETFSFNKEVGDISGTSGYKQAYVIKEGRTVLDDGGGVCQVSTTLFRAVLNAGLPIIQRVAHAYRVGYYEQGFPPGLDATVFSPSVDFKFKNDTPGYLLIQTSLKGTSLFIDIYGTSDGRITNLTEPIITNKTPPPSDIRQDDPTLPRGQVKQVDWSAWGANVSFNRTVAKNGETLISETWKSNYRPWQAIFLVGTKD